MRTITSILKLKRVFSSFSRGKIQFQRAMLQYVNHDLQ